MTQHARSRAEALRATLELRLLFTGYTGHMEFEWDPAKAAGNLRKHP